MTLPTNLKDLKKIEKLVDIRDTRVDFFLHHHVNSKGEPMRYEDMHYLHDIYNSLSPYIVLMSSTQSGKSEFLMIDSFAKAYHGLPVLHVLPKYDLRNRFVQNRVNKTIAYSKTYKKLSSSSLNRGVKNDSCSLKSFNGTTIAYAGSNVADDFIELPVDCLIVDELQHCDQPNMKLAHERMEFSQYKFKVFAGNPGATGRDIAKEFYRSNQREWHVSCKACNKLSQLDWFDTVVHCKYDSTGSIDQAQLRDTDWYFGCGRDIHAICPRCNGILERFKPGVWLPMNPKATSGIEGFHISKLITGITNYYDMWAEFDLAKESLHGLSHFYNNSLGLPYSSSGHQLSQGMMDKCIADYHLIQTRDEAYIPDRRHPGPCFLGVDPGKKLDTVIYASEGGRRKLVYSGKLNHLEDVYDLIEDFNVETAVMDSRPELHMAEEFTETAPCEAWMCHYLGNSGLGSMKIMDKEARINIEPTFLLDKGLKAFRKRKVILPINYADIMGGRYLYEMTCSVRYEEQASNGQTRYVWRAPSANAPDHQRHADGYALLAWEMSDVSDGAAPNMVRVL